MTDTINDNDTITLNTNKPQPTDILNSLSTLSIEDENTDTSNIRIDTRDDKIIPLNTNDDIVTPLSPRRLLISKRATLKPDNILTLPTTQTPLSVSPRSTNSHLSYTPNSRSTLRRGTLQTPQYVISYKYTLC